MSDKFHLELLKLMRQNEDIIYTKIFPNFTEYDIDYISERVKDVENIDSSLQEDLTKLYDISSDCTLAEVRLYLTEEPFYKKYFKYVALGLVDLIFYDEDICRLITITCWYLMAPTFISIIIRKYLLMIPVIILYLIGVFIFSAIKGYKQCKREYNNLLQARSAMSYILQGGDIRKFSYKANIDTVNAVLFNLNADVELSKEFLSVYKSADSVLMSKIHLYFNDVASCIDTNRKFGLEIDFAHLKIRIEGFMRNVIHKYCNSAYLTESVKVEVLENCVPEVD